MRLTVHLIACLSGLVFFLGSCSPKLYPTAGAVSEKGKASYYGDRFNGRSTASGETYSHGKLTAAHRTIPFGTMIHIKNLNNGKVVQVRINDRGPSTPGRIVDVSKSAARKLDMISDGVVPVEISYGKVSGSNNPTKKKASRKRGLTPSKALRRKGK